MVVDQEQIMRSQAVEQALRVKDANYYSTDDVIKAADRIYNYVRDGLDVRSK